MRRWGTAVAVACLAACGSGSSSTSTGGSGSIGASAASTGSAAHATASSGSASGASTSHPTGSSSTVTGAGSTGSGSSRASTASGTTASPTTSSGSTATDSTASLSSAAGTSTSATATGSTSSGGSTGLLTTSTSSGSSGSSGCGADGTDCTYFDGSAGTCCAGACQYDLQENSQFCGSCTNACPGDDFCGLGQCYPYTCENSGYCFVGDGGTPGACCGADGLTCIDPATDPGNCGTCGHSCGAGQTCANDQCVATDCTLNTNADLTCLSHGAPGLCCDGVCSTTVSDSTCLGCGEVCPVGGSCGSNDFCTTADGGYAYCSTFSSTGFACPSGTACTADGRCAPVAAACSAATLGSVCAGGGAEDRCCAAGCVDLTLDDGNCGSCGNVCGAGTWCYEAQCIAVPQCGAANSGTACPLGDGGAPGQCCQGSCVDLQADDANCGACGAACPSGQTCGTAFGSTGICVEADGGYGGCAGACAPGSVCLGSACYALRCPADATGVLCAFGDLNDGSATGRCCDGACVDVNQDPANCGACGTVCASGICFGNPPFDEAECTPNLNDAGPYDAGMFGFDCAVFGCGEPGLTCINHQCVSSAGCQFGGFDELCIATDGNPGSCCDNLFNQSSACHDLSAEPDNCGACGWACPAGSTCVDGACTGVSPACGPGHHGEYCDLDAGPSAVCCTAGCTDLHTDNANCGSCGSACEGGLTCVNGGCLALSCTASTEEQSCPAGDGGVGVCCSEACVDLGSDPLNCGSCAHHCPGGTTCEAGGCGVPSCGAAETGDPCHLPAGYLGTCCSESCVDTTRDSLNCGGCGLACSGDAGCSESGCQ